MSLDDEVIHKYTLHLRMQGKAETTIYARQSALHRLSRHLDQGEKPCLIRDAGRDQLIGWRAAFAGNADAYVLTQVSHIRCYLTWLCDEGHRDDNPGRHIPVPRKPSPVPHPIGEQELCHAIDCAPERIRLWLILAAFCGLRAKEIALLRRSNLRETGRSPHIFIAADATKGRREAVIPLRGYALAEVRAARLPTSGWAFPRLDGQPGPLSPHRVSQLCNECLHSFGYPDTLHGCRHFFGTETLRAANGNVRTAQRALRHQRLDTTAVYTLITDDEVAAAVAAIPAPRRLRAAS